MEGETSTQDFEKPLVELETRIRELERFQQKAGIDLSEEIAKLKAKCAETKGKIYAEITPWQRVLLARHQERPGVNDYLTLMFEDFVELHGDKAYGDDRAMVTGLARVGGIRVLLVGHRKGSDTKERMACNFGSPHPEGYRKALEKMKLAEKFRLPIVTLVNTPGAYPGIGAEERGQAATIAKNIMEMTRLRTPILSIVIGEGGSGGALGICVADRLSILENSYLSVISPEGCAAILWRDSAKAPLAAELLRLTPQDLHSFGIIDDVIGEPLGGAHRDPKAAAEALKTYMVRTLDELNGTPLDRLLEKRYAKYRKIGVFVEAEEARVAKSVESRA